MSFRPFIHQEQYSTDFWEKSFLTGRPPLSLCGKIAENYKLPYYTISPTYSVCSEHGISQRRTLYLSEMRQKAEVYSRITGYYRPVQNWNDGKAQEYKNRTLYDVVHSSLKKGSHKCSDND